ncbi:MAG: hypothetical protein D6797_02985 [Bdellovibrio sp.]|nr:MAG: hypothetical protein D6797_02985 [Bdellovibrio sp.]
METDQKSPKEETSQDGDTISLEDIDKLLEEEDPEFAEELEEISKDKEIQEAHVEGDEIIADEEPEEDEGPKSFKELFKEKVTHGFTAFIDGIYWLSLWVGESSKKVFFFLKRKALDIRIFFQTEFPERVRYFKSQLGAFNQQFLFYFKGLGLWRKILFVLSPLLFSGALFLVYKSFQKDFWPQIYHPYLSSFEEVADWTRSYKPQDLVLLRRAFPHKEYTILLDKIVVNLTPGPESGTTPMAYMEIYVVADTQASLVEIKEREKEFLDVISRTAEKFQYRDLSRYRGKQLFKEIVGQKLNKLLNVGNVTRVYFKEIIVKP